MVDLSFGDPLPSRTPVLTRIHPPNTAASPETLGIAPSVPKLVADRVAKVIELMRPTVQADGGDIELAGITAEMVVQVRMHGACVGCPSSAVTLQSGIERNLREHIPEIRGVIAV